MQEGATTPASGTTAFPVAPVPPAKPPLGLLGWIAGYKLLKCAGASAGGVMALRLVHHDLVKLALHWIERFGLDPQSPRAERLLRHVGHINAEHLHVVAGVLFLYAIIYVVEGVGLFYEKLWAEWLTAIQTALLIPWEAWEVIHRPGPLRIGALVANVLVVLYLIARIRRERGEHGQPVNKPPKAREAIR